MFPHYAAESVGAKPRPPSAVPESCTDCLATLAPGVLLGQLPIVIARRA